MIKYKVINNNAYNIYEKAMKILERELAIVLASKNAKNRSHHNHEEMATYRNVYLEHGKENCEIDEFILTRNALLLFEIKNTSADIIIDKHGRLYQNIRVYNHCHQVSWTTDQSLMKLMKKYQHYIPISTSEYERLKDILSDLQEAKKPFASPIDFHEILDILQAMIDEAFFYCDPVEQLHKEQPHSVSLMFKHCLQALKQVLYKKKLTLTTDFGDFYF